MSVKGIGFAADTHVNSIFGLMPPGFVNSAGVEVPLNYGQKWLWECWMKLADWFTECGIVALVFVGDVVDGNQEAQRGTEKVMAQLKDARDAAVMALSAMLSRLAVGLPFYMIQGTEYHDAKAGECADEVADKLKAVRYPGLGTGRRSRDMMDLEVDGVLLNVSHGISASSGFYRATALDREGIWSALAGKEGKARKADCLVRAHVHNFCHLEHASKHIVTTPGFQLQTRHMRKNSVYRMVPDLGGIIAWVDGEAKKKHEDPIRVSKKLFDLPEPPVARLVL
jgi:hypothetical protein